MMRSGHTVIDTKVDQLQTMPVHLDWGSVHARGQSSKSLHWPICQSGKACFLFNRFWPSERGDFDFINRLLFF